MRVENWNIKFVAALEELKTSGMTFGWEPPSSQPLEVDPVNLRGVTKFHCVSFAAHMVKVVTGKDYYQELAADLEYDSPLSAYKALKSLGYSSVDQLIGSIFPIRWLPYVIRGDLVLVPGDIDGLVSENPELEGIRLAVAVADPPFALVAHTNYGLGRVSLRQAVKAFAVGEEKE